jgi:hypothetical protein
MSRPPAGKIMRHEIISEKSDVQNSQVEEEAVARKQ